MRPYQQSETADRKRHGSLTQGQSAHDPESNVGCSFTQKQEAHKFLLFSRIWTGKREAIPELEKKLQLTGWHKTGWSTPDILKQNCKGEKIKRSSWGKEQLVESRRKQADTKGIQEPNN